MRAALCSRWPLWICLALGLALHLVLHTAEFRGPDATSYNAFIEAAQDWGYFLSADAFQGNFFPMGYPTMVSVFVKIGGGTPWLYQMASIFMALSIIAFGWTLTRGCGRNVQIGVSIALAVAPTLLWMGQNNGYEMLLCFLMTASLTLALRVQGRVGWWGARPKFTVSCLGLLMGLALLTQSKSIAVLLLLLIAVGLRSPVLSIVAGAWSFSLPLTWGIRNLAVQGSAWPFSTNGEMGIWLGNNPFTQTGGVVASMPPKPPGHATLWHASLDFVMTQPEAWFTLFTRRIARLLEPTYLYRDEWSLPGGSLLLHYIAIAFSVTLVLLFATFLFGRVWTKPPMIPPVGWLGAVASVFFLVHLPFQSESRYMAPVVPIMIMVAVPTGFWLVRRTRNSVLRKD